MVSNTLTNDKAAHAMYVLYSLLAEQKGVKLESLILENKETKEKFYFDADGKVKYVEPEISKNAV